MSELSPDLDATRIQTLWREKVLAGAENPSPEISYRPIEYGATLLQPQTVASGRPLDQTVLEAALAPRAEAAETLEALPTFELGDEIARGGMGAIHRARQTSLRRDVALKSVLPELQRPALLEQFVSEAWVTGSLDHPNIPPAHELAYLKDGSPVLAMKLVEGLPWSELLHPEDEAGRARAAELQLGDHLRTLIQVCNAVAFAHNRGILHRDLKPENVMIGEFGEVLVMDWGLAAQIGDPSAEARIAPLASEITSPGGTPRYMAPEQAAGEGDRMGPWTDVYLLGAILHELLTGRPPHSGSSFWAVLTSALRATPPKFDRHTPPELVTICLKALAGEPEKRYATATQFRDALQTFLAHRESVVISDAARQALNRVKSTLAAKQPSREERVRLYGELSEALAGFRQARRLWKGNRAAHEGEAIASLDLARVALEGHDLGLAEATASSLDESQRARGDLLARIESARAEDARVGQRARRMRAAVVTLLGVVSLGALIASVLVTVQRNQARESARVAEDERARAETAQRVAEEATVAQRELTKAATRDRIRAEEAAEEQARLGRVATLARAHAESSLRQAISSRKRAEDSRRRAEDSRRQAEESRRQAEDSRRRAELSAQEQTRLRMKAEALVESLQMAISPTLVQVGRKDLVDLIARRIRSYYGQPGATREKQPSKQQLSGDARARREGMLLIQEAEDLLSRGQLAAAHSRLTKGLALARRARRHNDEVTALRVLARVLRAQGRAQESIQALRRCISICTRVRRRDNFWEHTEGCARTELSWALRAQHTKESVREAQRAVESFRRIRNPRPRNLHSHAEAHLSAGAGLFHLGDMRSALTAFQAGLRISERLCKKQPKNPEFLRQQAVAHEWLLRTNHTLERLREAQSHGERGLAVWRRIVVNRQHDPRLRRQEASLQMGMAELKLTAGDRRGAARALNEAKRIYQRITARHPGIDHRRQLGEIQRLLAQTR